MMRPPSSSARRPGTAVNSQKAASTTAKPTRPSSALKRQPIAKSTTATTSTQRPGSARGAQQTPTTAKTPPAQTSARPTVAKAQTKPGQLPPSSSRGVKKQSTQAAQEESKVSQNPLAAADNPWGLDESQYYIELGGVSKFLQFRNSLKKAPSGKVLASENEPVIESDPLRPTFDSSETLISKIEKVLHLLDQVNRKSMQYQKAHALRNYSDLLLAESTNYRTEQAQELASFLAEINSNQERLLREVRQASRMSENCLVLSKTYHAEFVKALQAMALDLQKAIEKAPVGVEKTTEEMESLGEMGQAGMRQAANYKRLKDQLSSLKATVDQLHQGANHSQ